MPSNPQPSLFPTPARNRGPSFRAAREAMDAVPLPAVRGDHPETSRQAAASIAPTAATLREKVYDAIAASAAGLTDEQIQRYTGIGPSTERPRRIELCEAGRVVDSGVTRATRSGRKAIVWKAVPW